MFQCAGNSVARHYAWLAAALSMFSATANADIFEWTNPVSGNFNTAANWTLLSGPGPAPPNVGDEARFNEANLYTVSFLNNESSDFLNLTNGNVTFRSNGSDRTYSLTTGNADASILTGALSLGVANDPLHLAVGDDLTVNSGGALVVEHGSDVTVGDDVNVGTNGGGGSIFVVGSGSTIGFNDAVIMGIAGGTGTISLQVGSTGNSIGGLLQLIGNSGVAGSTGRLEVLTGSKIETSSIIVGSSGSPTLVQEATLTVDGSNSELTMLGAATLTVGDDVNPNITADLLVNDGGTFHTGTGAVLIRNSGRLLLGAGGTFNANGNVTIDGGTVARFSDDANLNLANGCSLTAQNGALLEFTGDYTINNNTTWTLQSGADYNTTTSTDTVRVGDTTNGTLIIENSGSTLNLGPQPLSASAIGLNGGAGTLTIRHSAAANFSDVAIASFGAGSTGVLNIENGAQVTANHVYVGFPGDASNSATINLGGTTGTATLTQNGASQFQVGGGNGGSATVNINSGGRLITGTGPTTVGTDGLVVVNGGELTLNGDLTIDGGTVRRQSGSLIFKPSSNVLIDLNSELEITGTFAINNGVDLTVRQGATYSSTGATNIGLFTSGTLLVEGGSVSAGGDSWWGAEGGSANVVFRSAIANFNTVRLAQTINATSIVTVEDGSQVTFSALQIANGSGASSSGELTIRDPFTTVNVTAASPNLNIGRDVNGTATLNVLDGGTFSSVARINLWPTGTINLDGGSMVVDVIDDLGGTFNYLGGSLSMNEDFTLGFNGLLHTNSLALGSNDAIATDNVARIDPLATLTLDGGTLSAGELVNDGTLEFNRGKLRITGGAGMTIGAGGPLGSNVAFTAGQRFEVTNTLTVDAGATLVVGSGAAVEAGTLANSGSVVLEGAAAVLGGTNVSNSGVLRGEGVVLANVTNNEAGEIRAQGGKTLAFSGSNGANTGLVNLQGGTLEFAQAIENDSQGNIVGRGTLSVGGTGLANEGHIALSSGISDIFGDVVNDTGNAAVGITISGNADVSFWDDVTNTSGLFRVSANSSATFFGAFGGGGISGTGDVYFEADITPGSSPATVTFGGNMILGTTATLLMELGGTTLGSQYDHVDVAGHLVVDGTLRVELIDGFAPAAGDSFNLLDWNTTSGAFAALDLPALGGGLMWNTSQLDSNGVLAVTLGGDFNFDGAVDAADYLLWRRGLGMVYTPADYYLWTANFGQQIPGSGTASQAVPEPPPIYFAILGAICCFGRAMRSWVS